MGARARWVREERYTPACVHKVLSRAAGRTMSLARHRVMTLTVLGSAGDRLFAAKCLAPVMLRCVRELGGHDPSIPVHVTYCNACGPRVLPGLMGAELGREHVNGGLCMGSDMGVLVFRRQDAQKVLIHELVHLFDIDAPLRNLSDATEMSAVRSCAGLWTWTQRRAGHVPVALAEAYTDALACLAFCGGDVIRARTHAVAVAARVLHHFGWGRLPFRETTHAFSYYVVKAAILVGLDGDRDLLSMLRTSPPAATVAFMGRSLRSARFRSALTEASREGGGAKGQEKGIQMTDGRPMVF